MANAPDNQACSSFAATFAQLLARVLNRTEDSAWEIGLAPGDSAKLPAIDSPVQYCLRLGERLRGSCYAVFSQADVAGFAGAAQSAAKDADMVADAEQLVESPAAGLLERMRSLAAALPEALAAVHGLVTAVVEQVDVLDPEAGYGLQLQAKDGKGKAAIILLHFNPELQKALAPPMSSTPNPPIMDKKMTQGNLGLVMDVELSCTLRFGQRQLTLREILDLASGSVVELDRQVDEPVELILDGRVIARGEAVIIDGNYGLRVTQVLHTVDF